MSLHAGLTPHMQTWDVHLSTLSAAQGSSVPHLQVGADPEVSHVSARSVTPSQASPVSPQTHTALVSPSAASHLLLSPVHGSLTPHRHSVPSHIFTSSPVHSELEAHRQLVPSQVSAVISHVGLVPQ